MQGSEAIELIRMGVTSIKPQCWTDLACGSGTFTAALNELLPMGSRLTAVDRTPQKSPLNFILADFEQDELPLSHVDGILMANSLHFIANKVKFFEKLKGHFADGPTFLIVEHDTILPSR